MNAELTVCLLNLLASRKEILHSWLRARLEYATKILAWSHGILILLLVARLAALEYYVYKEPLLSSVLSQHQHLPASN